MASSRRLRNNKYLFNTTKRNNAQVKHNTRKRSDGRGDEQACSSVPLLDMLAEVASATLKNDPTLHSGPSAYSKYMERSPKNNGKSAHQNEVLTLDQIRVLSDRMLLEMFSELVSDEMKRQYSYKCFLMPEKCSETFKSFGNENKARLQMKSHLLTHIAELLAQANGPGKSPRFRFTAEPLSARKKRLQDGTMNKKRKKVFPMKSSIVSKKILRAKEISKKQSSASALKPSARQNNRILQQKENYYFSNASGSGSDASDSDNPSDDNVSMDDSDAEVPKREVIPAHLQKGRTKIKRKPTAKQKTEKEIFEESCAKRQRLQNGNGFPLKRKTKKVLEKKVAKSTSCSTNETETSTRGLDDCSLDNVADTYGDHCYTSATGKKKGIESLHLEITFSDDDEASAAPADPPLPKRRYGYMYDSPQLIVATPTFPFIYVPLLPNIAHITEIESGKNCIFRKSSSSDTVSSASSSKSIPTGDSKDSDSGSDASVSNSQPARGRRPHLINTDVTNCEDGTSEWERKLALKYIRSLRTKKKEDRGALVCRICKTKTFTAQATLMYHYRSHAGIKPFICTICGATFTRQHSLNYHMLIHNNKSRFVCGDCGRMFRHPSHYKEHLRRHTGETPYECGDCALRFKTRNTYKRHLKTRHGKILTAQGIITMSPEEFYKVRTNPRKKILTLSPTRKKDQETQWPEEFDEESELDDGFRPTVCVLNAAC